VTLKLASIIPIWLLVIAASIAVALREPRLRVFTWLPIVLAAAVILTFCVQLGIRRKEGFNGRLALSTGGAFVIVAVAAAILWVLR